ncbi:MAG TPA: BTAD domain-containing putative transcriptional regulator [Acidisphaera sp.]|nr:BTAD domain-containing putative transcriptional regulator [Acidisphaera sp.]
MLETVAEQERRQGRLGPPEPADSTVLRLRLIGQMDATTASGESVLPAGRKTRALLAVLALTSPRAALRGKLAELLWSRRPEEQARASLRQEIHRLLETLAPAGEVLSVSRDHLSLRSGAFWADVQEIMRATTAQPASLSLLDGDLLEDLDGVDPNFDAWLTTERERLRDRARRLAEQLLEEQREPATAIPAAQRVLAIDRSHEGAWRALMRAHAARGERGMAIQAYERCRAVLADLLDAAPSVETQRLLAEIRGPASRPAPRRPSGPMIEPPAALPAALAAPPPGLEAPPASRSAGRGPRIGVLPPQTVSANHGENHLALGLASEITTALTRSRGLHVISSHSLAHFAESTRDETAIRETFVIDYLLDGSVQHVGDRVRVTLRLLDLSAGNQVAWARRFDRESDDLLGVQDEIAAQVAAQIEPEILAIEARRVAAAPPANPSAYELMLRALPLVHRLQRDSFLQAGQYLAEAMKAEPDYAAPFAWYAWWHIILVGQGWHTDLAAARQRAGELAERALSLDARDARILTIAGHVTAYLHRRPADALVRHDRALSQNPNLTMAWVLSGLAHAYLGNLDEAEHRFERYKQLSPLDPYAFGYDMLSVLIPLLRRDHWPAVEAGRRLSQMGHAFASGQRPYLAALGHMGIHAEAALVRDRLFAINPRFTVQTFRDTSPFVHEADTEHYAEGLLLAGVPER